MALTDPDRPSGSRGNTFPTPKLPGADSLGSLPIPDLTSALGDVPDIFRTSFDLGSLPSDPSEIARPVQEAVKEILEEQTAEQSITDFYSKRTDPFYNALDPNATPRATGFRIDPLKGELGSLGGLGSIGGSLLSRFPTGQLSAMASRFSQSFPLTDGGVTSLLKSASSAFKGEKLSGLFGSLGSTLGSVASSFVSSPLGSLVKSGVDVAGYVKDFQEFCRGKSPSSLLSTFQNGRLDFSLPRTADSRGKPIKGIPSHLDPKIISGLRDVAKDHLGVTVGDACSDLPDDSFGFQQNLFNQHIDLLSENDLVCLLAAYLKEGNAKSHRSAREVLTRSVKAASERGSSDTVATIVSGVSAGFFGGGDDIVGNLLRKGIQDKFNLPQIQTVATEFGVTAPSLVSDTISWDDGSTSRIYREKSVRKYDRAPFAEFLGEDIHKYTRRNREVRSDPFSGMSRILLSR